MNSHKKYYLIGLCIALHTAAWANVLPGTLVDKAVAQVDDHVILKSELEIAYQQYLLQGFEEVPNMRQRVLRYLIGEKIQLAQAKREGHITMPDKIVEELLQKRIVQLVEQAGSVDVLTERLGQSLQSFKAMLREQISNTLILGRVREQVANQVSVTPQEVETFFNTLNVQEQTFLPAEVVLRQIVQYPSVNQQEKDIFVEQLKSLKTRVQEGENFSDLAQEYSQDPGSASKGGEIGFKKRGELDPEYEAAALMLQPGEVSAPVATQFGFHLIQLIAREGELYNTRHILLKPGPETLDLAATERVMTQLRADILAEKLNFEQAVKKYSQDIRTVATGGLLLSHQGRARQVVDELPEDVFFAIESLNQGEISEPILFTTPDNREAFRILWVEKKIEPHAASLEQDYEQIKQRLLEQKKVKALQDWMKKAESEVCIKLAPEYQGVMQKQEALPFE